jgi:hypothetical protein
VVSYTAVITRKKFPVRVWVMLLRLMAGRLVLPGEDEEILDARYLRWDEIMYQGDEVCFACHDEVVGERFGRDRRGASMLP